MVSRKLIDFGERFNQDTGSFSGKWSWNRAPRTSEEQSEWVELASVLSGVEVHERQDKWEWQGGKENSFSVKNVKDFIVSGNDYSSRYVVKWCKWVPKKCSVFIWRAAMDRIPTKTGLTARNCWNGDMSCVLCGEGQETTTHLFCECGVAARIWHFISKWSRSTPFFVFDIKDILEFHEQQGKSKVASSVLKGIIIISCWCIWKARNEKIFDGVEVKTNGIIHNIKTLGFLWFKNRTKYRNITWEDWCNFIFL